MARILIVDDDRVVSLLIESMLTDLGYEVAGQAKTGTEAIAMARDLKPDLILMDVRLPGGMNGIDAAMKIKAESNIPIVFISGYGDPELIEKAKIIEPFGYVMKPFDKTEVKAFVEIALYKSKMERKLGQANKQLNDMNLSLQQEITERKQVEEALRHSEEKYRELVENLNDVIYSVSADGTITYVSSPVESALGYTPVELMGKHFTYLIHPEDLGAIQEAFAEILQGRFYPREYRMRTKSGEFRWVRTSSLPILDDGQISGLQGVITDITEYKRAEDALRESERNYHEIFNNSSDAIFVHDVETGAIVDANKTVCDVFGYTLEEIKALEVRDLSVNTPPYTNEESLQWIRKAAEQGPQHFEWIAKNRDGRLIWFENSLLHANIGGKNRILVFGRVIDERKRVEEERAKLESQLHRAQKMAAMGTLVAGVAHEINNPNNFISINAPMLNKAWLSIIPILEEYYDHNGDFSVGGLPYTTMRERVPQLLAGISDGSGRIKNIVSDLKRFARPDSSASFEPVDINSAVKSSLTLVSNLLRESTNNFKVEYGHNIPKINGNHQHLEQVVINLVQNACQALPDKNKEICVSTTYREKEGTILIKIRDQGVGIPSESLPKIMDPFFTTRRSSGGTGLGLSVSFSIIEKHSGKLTVTSEEGKGTTFTIALPVKGKKGRVKVLVVDDDDLLRETIVETLEKYPSFSVEESSDGIDACIKLGSFRPDLLILDIRMPGMNGVEVCKRIKEDLGFSNMKVIIITGFPGGDDAGEIAGMGFGNFCTKPVKMKDFEAMVQKVLNRD